MDKKNSICIVLICLFLNSLALKIYKSNADVPNGKVNSGLSYKKNVKRSVFVSNNFTACIHVYIKRMSTDGSAMLLTIDNVNHIRFLRLYARYPVTWFHFGTESSWILCDPTLDKMDDSCLVWRINKWHHLCFSYSESNSFISFVKVRKNSLLITLI